MRRWIQTSDGGHRGAAIAEEADAVGDFFADAVQREQAGKEGVVGENGQRIEVEGAAAACAAACWM